METIRIPYVFTCPIKGNTNRIESSPGLVGGQHKKQHLTVNRKRGNPLGFLMFSLAFIKKIDLAEKYIYRCMSSTGNENMLGILAHRSAHLIARHACYIHSDNQDFEGQNIRN